MEGWKDIEEMYIISCLHLFALFCCITVYRSAVLDVLAVRCNPVPLWTVRPLASNSAVTVACFIADSNFAVCSKFLSGHEGHCVAGMFVGREPAGGGTGRKTFNSIYSNHL